jgi:type II secretory pathway pseudopilin PulG
MHAPDARGYAMAALLVGLGIAAVMLSAAMPVWRQLIQREKEEELIFRGRQYARAIELFQRKFGTNFPPNLDILIEQKLLRKRYKDPITNDDFELLSQFSGQPAAVNAPGAAPRGSTTQAQPGQSSSQRQGASGTGQGTGPRGPIIGVASKSTDTSIRLYNGRSHYNEWQFVYIPAATRPGMAPGGQGGRGQGGRGMGPGQPGGRGMGPGGRGMGPGGRGMGPGGFTPGGFSGPGSTIPDQPRGRGRGGS